jgi:hypothetical protein
LAFLKDIVRDRGIAGQSLCNALSKIIQQLMAKLLPLPTQKTLTINTFYGNYR